MAERRYLTPLGHPQVNEAFSGLKTIVRRYKINGDGLLAANVDDVAKGFRAYATADDEFPNALLIRYNVEPMDAKPNTHDLTLVEVYSEFEDNQKTAVGEDQVTYDESDRKTVVRKYVAKSEDAETVAAAIGDVDGGGLACAGVQIVKDGVGATIIETYIEAGQLSETTQNSNNGALINKTLVHYNEVPPTPVGFTLVDTTVQNPDGIPTYTYRFAKGEGLISERIDARGEGLRVQTWVSLGTKLTPAGVVISEDEDDLDGHVRFTVSCMQNPTGGSPTTGSFSFEQYRPWTYPGRAFPYEVLISDYHLLDVFQSPPVTLDLEHTVTIDYSSSGSLSISNFWQPDNWAVVIVKMIGLGENPISIVKALPGYRSTDETALSYTEPGTPGDQGSVMGNQMYGSTTATVQVIGGPEDPGGDTYTVEARSEPAFTGVDGTIYYRRTIVTVAVPAQPALPTL
jgi:hypothetical protein